MSTTHFRSESSDDFFDSTLRELKERLGSEDAIEVFAGIDETGKPYTVIHGQGEGARLLQRMLLLFGALQPASEPHMAKGDSA